MTSDRSSWGLKLGLVLLAVGINFFYLNVLYDVLPSYTSSSWKHIPLAYNYYKYGTLTCLFEDLEYKTQKAIPIGFYEVPELPSTNDTVGYAFLVGTLWKVTDSLDLIDVQLLQILFFCLTVFLIYQIGLLLFHSKLTAFLGSLSIIFWYHLVLMNVIPARDIWGYYGGVVLAYVLIKFFLDNEYGYKRLILGASFFSFCQFLRPNIFGQLLTLSAALCVLFYLYKRPEMKRCFGAVTILLLANMVCFWIPFMGFNKLVYDRYFVGPIGHGLIASLGTVENPWGLKCDDQIISEYIGAAGVVNTANHPEYNESGFKAFLKLVRQNPFIYIKALIVSVKSALFYEVEAIINFFKKCSNNALFFTHKVQEAWALDSALFFLKFLEHFSSKVLRIIGYFGLIVGLYKRRSLPIIFLMLGVFSGMWMLLMSHFEEKYIVPFSWPFALFAGYFLEIVLCKICDVIKTVRRENRCIKKIV